MKELSIEQKAKRYDEAIEIAKKINNEQQAQPFNVMTRVFPELKESEDERIRKDLIIYLRSVLSNKKYGDKFIEDWIAWLEKQGKTSPVFSNSSNIGKDEQKQEWSEEDEKMWTIISDLLWDGYKLSDKKVSWDDIRDWIKPKIESIIPQNTWKPSDEQIETLSHMIEAVESEWAYEETIGRELLKQLKKLTEE